MVPTTIRNTITTDETTTATTRSRTTKTAKQGLPATHVEEIEVEEEVDEIELQDSSSSSQRIHADRQTAIVASLQAACFEQFGLCFIHGKFPRCEVEVELDDSLGNATITITATAAGLGEAELARFVAMELAADRPQEFGAQLVEGVQSMLHMSGTEADAAPDGSGGGAAADGGAAGNGGSMLERALEKLPSIAQVRSHPRWVDSGLDVKRDRRLHIYTWGDALMKKTALKSRRSQFDVNAKPLNGRGGGADTKQNALQDQRIMVNVAGSLADARGMQLLVQTLRKIEAEDLSVISTFCTKGRHRSVSLALLLKHGFYPHATIEHLTIK